MYPTIPRLFARNGENGTRKTLKFPGNGVCIGPVECCWVVVVFPFESRKKMPFVIFGKTL